MILAFATAFAMTIAIRLTLGPHERMVTALRATARWSFVWFWLASVAAPLCTLFGPRFKPLAQHARDLGLSFASAHLVHIGLVAWMYVVSVPDLGRTAVILFSTGAVWTYLIAILSFADVSKGIPPRAVRLFRITGVEYISVVFFIDFYKNPFGGGWKHAIFYAPFVALTAVGPILRLAAAIKRQANLHALVTS
jgi:hypothetical protein